MIVLFAGTKSASHDLHLAALTASERQEGIIPIYVDVNCGSFVQEHQSLANLKTTGQLNMPRMLTELRDVIEQYWWRYLNDEGKTDDWIDANVEWRDQRFVSERPDLLARLVQEPEFSHINVIIFDVMDGQGTSRVGAIVRPESIKEILVNAEPYCEPVITDLGITLHLQPCEIPA